MKKLILMSAMLLSGVVSLYGQSSARGYLGKVNTTSYSPSFTFLHIRDEEFIQPYFQHRIAYDRVVSKRSAFGCVLGYSQIEFYPWRPDYTSFVAGNQNVTVLEIGFKYIHSKKVNSPIGPFRELGVSLLNSTYKVGAGDFVSEDPSTGWVEEERTGKGTNLLLSYGWGTRRMVSQSVFLQYGVDFTYAFALTEGKSDYYYLGTTEEEFNDYVNREAAYMAGGFTMSLKLALGIVY